MIAKTHKGSYKHSNIVLHGYNEAKNLELSKCNPDTIALLGYIIKQLPAESTNYTHLKQYHWNFWKEITYVNMDSRTKPFGVTNFFSFSTFVQLPCSFPLLPKSSVSRFPFSLPNFVISMTLVPHLKKIYPADYGL